MNLSLTHHPKLVETLLRDGLVIVDGYLSTEEAREWLQRSLPVLEQARRGGLPENTYTNQPKIISRLSPGEHFSQSLQISRRKAWIGTGLAELVSDGGWTAS